MSEPMRTTDFRLDVGEPTERQCQGRRLLGPRFKPLLCQGRFVAQGLATVCDNCDAEHRDLEKRDELEREDKARAAAASAGVDNRYGAKK